MKNLLLYARLFDRHGIRHLRACGIIPKACFLWICLFLFNPQGLRAQSKQVFQMDEKFIDQQLGLAANQLRILASSTPLGKFPQTFEQGKLRFSNSSWWCSGFFPGSLLLVSEGTKDESLKELALRKLPDLEGEQFNKGTHDLGFMLFCSFGNALRLSNDTAAYLPILRNGAESLSSRYNAKTKTIRSWDHGSWKFAVIIDNMMNLEFLTQLSKITGDPTYKDIAISHANATIKHHFRKDNSTYHVIDYNPLDGTVLSKKTHQGAFDESSWARGQAWGLYGFTMLYRETGLKSYLKQAQKIADFVLSHPNMPKDLIPYWDFDFDKISTASKIYAKRELRDASAAAIMASALLELAQYSKGKSAKRYFTSAESMLKTLSGSTYFAKEGELGGFILKHSVGALPLQGEIDVPLTYADYYYVESLLRYQRLLRGESIIKF
ncbi:glycoside hydrolase family 88 protein [Sphingobacterium sp. HJSM2_6]|uniref:glycoside hydrolase family 88 protein n=1 Tax=Sphingobacterium sp. HJSM2_6 TaxID=3366264 RepID=UPI003BDC00E1